MDSKVFQSSPECPQMQAALGAPPMRSLSQRNAARMGDHESGFHGRAGKAGGVTQAMLTEGLKTINGRFGMNILDSENDDSPLKAKLSVDGAPSNSCVHGRPI